MKYDAQTFTKGAEIMGFTAVVNTHFGGKRVIS